MTVNYVCPSHHVFYEFPLMSEAISSQNQQDEISGWVVDLFDAATSEADKGPKLRAAILRAKKGLEENPEWIPDANTTLDW